MKILDAFLFFQELDLLEIRLNYLDKHVDKFLIVEACQTFSGNPKKFIFEENAQRYKKYLHKIVYHKINDFHDNYQSIQDFLYKSGTSSHKKILEFLNDEEHYSKDHLNWLLDSYHHECMHLILDKVAKDDDIVIFSDLDEIPSQNIFNQEQLSLIKLNTMVCKQKEFRYFLNYYKDSNWLGSIVGKFENIKYHSIGKLRRDANNDRIWIYKDALDNGGYHFTSCGDISLIKQKIKSWGHQEFNNSLIDKNIENNILTGQDIFFREAGTNLRRIDPSDSEYFDDAMQSVIINFRHMLSFNEIKFVKHHFYSDFFRRFFMVLQKVNYKISLAVRKIKRKKAK